MRSTPAPMPRNSVHRTHLIIAVVAFVICASVQLVQAQTDYGSLLVIVRVPQGIGTASGITVSLVSARNGSKNLCITDADGRCRFDSLEPGLYELGVHLLPLSEKPDKVRRVLIRFGQQSTRVITLSSLSQTEIAAQQEKRPAAAPTPSPTPSTAVRVPFAGVLAETVTPGRLGVSGTSSDLERLPNRNLRDTSLFDLLPGAFTDAFGGISINGQSSSQNVLIQGGLARLPGQELSTASFQDTGALFIDIDERQSLKTYESFSISTSNTPAKLGTGTGGQLLKDIVAGEQTYKFELYEYLANDKFSARNFFDFTEKPALRFNLFGANLSGPLYFKKEELFPKLFAFVNYEGIRARAGNIVFEAAPSLALRNRIAPVLLPVLNLYRAGGATVLADASTDPNFDTLKLESKNKAQKDSVTARFDFNATPRDTLGFIYLNSHSREDLPDGVTGRRFITTSASQTAIFNYKRTLKENSTNKDKLTNQFIFGFQSEPVRTFASNPSSGVPEMSRSAVALDGEISTTGIAGKPFPLSVAMPGNLLTGASDFNGTDMRFAPRWLSFVDQVVWKKKNHLMTFGGELRLIRNSIDQQFGTTYKFSNIDDFLANRSTAEHSGDLGSFNNRLAAGERKVAQEYYIGYAQDEWRAKSNLMFTYGLRYEYYSVLREVRNRALVFDPLTGSFLENEPFYRSRKTNFLPRVSFAWAPGFNPLNDDPIKIAPTVISGSFGMHVGPDTLDHILRPIFEDRLRVSQGGSAFPADTNALADSFFVNTDNRKLKLRALSRDYISPLRVYKFDATYKRALVMREVTGTTEDDDDDDRNVEKEFFLQLTYAGARSRGLPLRNFSNRIVSVTTNPNPAADAEVRREFDNVSDGQVRTPYGEIEYLTTGGIANYDSFQMNLKGRAKKFLRYLDIQYTLARNYGNTDGGNATVGNPLDYDYDLGFNADDVRHKFSFGTLFMVRCDYLNICTGTNNRFIKELLGGWSIGAIGSFQTGTPIDVRVKRPDVVYIDGNGHVFGSPAVGRSAILNVPGGGSSVVAFRPNLIPGVPPYLGIDRRYLNPEAFSIPAPGVLGNMKRGALRGPGMRIIDFSIRKEIGLQKEQPKDKQRILSFNVDITNLFNFTNFKSPPATLSPKLGTNVSEKELQPDQAFTFDAAGDSFGVLNRTAKRKFDLGSSRQIQFGVSIKF